MHRKEAIEARLREIQRFDGAMLTEAIEQGFSKIGQNCRHLSWERLDKAALIACSRGLGATALANFCRLVSRGARRAGLPDLMLWRQVDGNIASRCINGSHWSVSPGVYSARAVEVKGPRDSVREEQRFVALQMHQILHSQPLSSALHLRSYWMHELLRCGVVVELMRVREPQEVSQPAKARKSSTKQQQKSRSVRASAAVKRPSLRTNDAPNVITISSDDDVFEK